MSNYCTVKTVTKSMSRVWPSRMKKTNVIPARSFFLLGRFLSGTNNVAASAFFQIKNSYWKAAYSKVSKLTVSPTADISSTELETPSTISATAHTENVTQRIARCST